MTHGTAHAGLIAVLTVTLAVGLPLAWLLWVRRAARRGRGTPVYHLRDYGAVPGQVCDQAFARALAEIPPGPAILLIPRDLTPWLFARPIRITRADLTIQGEG